jgi:hypothetical protein
MNNALFLMYNKHTTALYAAIIASVLVASAFAIGYVQMALAQGNMTGGASGGSNMTGGNMTGGASGGSNMTGGGSSGGAGGGA